MASIIPTAIMALSHHTPTVRDSLSGIFGSISLTAWICLLLPQLIANYRAQSADGLSMGFLFIWLLGDITNLVGALFTHLAPSAVALAFYFCIADIVLISQSMYYNAKNARRSSRHRQPRATDDQASGEEDPLLNESRRRTSSTGLPGSQRRHEVHTETSLEPLRKIVTGEDDTPDSNPWLHNTLSLLAVWLVGAAGWFISYKAGAWDADHGSSDPQSPEEDGTMAKVGLALGYFSAVCYLLARVPQINARRSSRHRQPRATDDQASGEEDPLLNESRRRTSSTGLPGSQRRHEVHTETSLEPLRKIVTGEDDTPDSNPWLHNTLSLLAVWLVGAAGWFISYKAGAWDADHGSSDPQSPEEDGIMAKVGLALGYFSAVCYLLARVPQIVKNHREKSCEGLALLFFLLSLTGNLSYGASLIAYSQDPHYLLKALPWLVGSLGTIAEDMVIFAQFHLYASERTSTLASAA
ncbi:hypothetical protein BN1723_016400 [Verticillium longisporum]|uniref:Vacuolar membrane PQ loop repeat protein n=1 Tax=Verticillium longisporum TaxID=100787 RepID=A0A0G4NEX3_VERLO|nr:hypothetical protein BN1723_016400 [Verticillium longisporum]